MSASTATAVRPVAVREQRVEHAMGPTRGVLAVSSRTVMNNVGYQDAEKARQLYRGTHCCSFAM
jgi:hypothetical protein